MADLDFLKTVDNLTSGNGALAARLKTIVRALADLRKLCTNPIKRKAPAKKVVKIDNAEKKSPGVRGKKCLDGLQALQGRVHAALGADRGLY